MIETSIQQMLSARAERTPDAEAILGDGRKLLTYRDLSELIANTGATLNQHGVGRNDRVAVVLPNGPEMAASFLAISSFATCAPLNPAYRGAEFDFYLSDLNARAVVLPAGAASPARDVAEARGIPVLELTADRSQAGVFTLNGPAIDRTPETGAAEPEDIALVLHTSGTTSRPKIVPLMHSNLCASAGNICQSLQLSDHDRCLNIMPLFHIHGLIAAVLSSLAAGGSVVCTPGFDGEKFFTWLNDFSPTWYTAVPTMHQAILSQPQQDNASQLRTSLRFIRSCSSALPPPVMKRLEERFGVPVVEAYGMTEASHQVACNPLPPRERRAGSVGVAAGPEVAIMDDKGNLLPPATRGEIVIKGPNVLRGYENNESANAKSFTNGWFRTGDEGILTEDGYLSLTDRIKEIFNRGGEKVSPREIDEALMEHPGVAQAVSFALPHPELGEEIAAAVVPRPGQTVTDLELREFAARGLAAHKVPRQILIMSAIPKGPTGKLQRIGLGEKLKDLLQGEFVPPRTDVELKLAEIWQEMLGIEKISVTQNFFLGGGSSLKAMQMFVRVEDAFHVRISPDAFFRQATIAGVAAEIERKRQESPAAEIDPAVVPIQTLGDRPPFFMADLALGWEMREVSQHLGPDQPVYGLQPSEILDSGKQQDARSIAAHYVDALRKVRPHGPYMLGGGCAAGVVAFEMAQQLLAMGEKVPLLALFDVDFPPPKFWPGLTGLWLLRLPRETARLWRMPMKDKCHYLSSRMKIWTSRIFGRQSNEHPHADPEVDLELKFAPLRDCVWRYTPQPYPGHIELLLAADTGVWPLCDRRLLWRKIAKTGCGVNGIPGEHHLALKGQHARETARILRSCMDAALEQ